jgi:drug/metabolite transporter (DMT)-like permease
MHISVILAAFSAMIIFGASPVAAKIAVSSIAVIDVALLRTVIGGMVALPLALALGIGLPRQSYQRKLLLVSGFCGFVGFPLLFTMGVMRTSANHASMILAALPVLTGLIAMTWDKQLPKSFWWAGCAVALAGEAILISNLGVVDGRSTVSGDLLVLVSNIFASIGYVAGGRLQRSGYSAKGTTLWGVSIFAILLIPLLPFLLHVPELKIAAVSAWIAVLYLAVGVTIVGYVFWYWALGSGGIARVGLLQFLQPVSGVVLAWILLGENMTPVFMLASGIILSGIWIALRAK